MSDNSSYQNPQKRFYHQDSSMRKSTRRQTKISKVVAIILKGLGALLVGRNMGVGVLHEHIVVVHVVIRDTI